MDDPIRLIARQADVGLDRLLATLIRDRLAWQSERQPPINRQHRSLVHKRLLTALESYTSALSARGLAAPPKLRDELELHRKLAARV